MMWVGLVQSVDGLKGKRLKAPKEVGILPPDSLQTWAAASLLPWVSILLAHPADFGFASLYNKCVSQFLKILSLSLSYYFFVCFFGRA